MMLREKARSSGLSRMVIWPVSPRSKSVPARRRRSGVGRARCSTGGRSLVLFANFEPHTLVCLFRRLVEPAQCEQIPIQSEFTSSLLRDPSALGGGFAATPDIRVHAAKSEHRPPQACARSALSRVLRRPIGPRTVGPAIRLARERLRAAEEEIRTARIADRPPACTAAKF